MRPQQGVQLMCDFSAEAAKQRPAEVNDHLVVSRLVTPHPVHKVIGTVSPDDTGTAVCLLPGTTLMARNIPQSLRVKLGLVGSHAVVTFMQRDIIEGEFYGQNMFRDGLVFAEDPAQRHWLFEEVGEGLDLSVLTIPGVTELPGESGEVAVHNPASVDQGEHGVWQEIASEYA